MRILLTILFAVALLGCEDSSSSSASYHGDPDLVAVAEAETSALEVTFNLAMSEPCSITWGASSQAWIHTPQAITINVSVRGNPPAIREHVRHECLHILYGEHGHPAAINNVAVHEYVPSWHGEMT